MENTCGSCVWWRGNSTLLGGPCELHGGLKAATSSCDCYESRMSFVEKAAVFWLFLLGIFCGAGSLYFTWFLFWRAGYFG